MAKALGTELSNRKSIANFTETQTEMSVFFCSRVNKKVTPYLMNMLLSTMSDFKRRQLAQQLQEAVQKMDFCEKCRYITPLIHDCEAGEIEINVTLSL
jgi:hypothetical protein